MIFFEKSTLLRESYYSDTETVHQSRSSKRSTSGKLYKTQLNFPACDMDQSSNNIVNVNTMEDNITNSSIGKVQSTIAAASAKKTGNITSTPYAGTSIVTPSITTAISITTCRTISSTPTLFTSLQSKVAHDFNNGVQGFKRFENGNSTVNMMETMDRETTSCAEPSLQSLHDLLGNISTQLASIQIDVKSLKEDKECTAEDLQGIQFELEDNQEDIASQKKELCQCQDKVDILTGIALRYEESIWILNERCNRLEKQNLKSEILIFGLKEQENKTCVDLAKSFMTEQLEMATSPDISFAYWKGKGANRPMVIRLSSTSAKGRIYSNVSNLKNKKNEDEKAFKVIDHLPEELAEKQQHNAQIVAQNKQLSTADQLIMKIKKGKLSIGNEMYCKKLNPPTVANLLDFPEDNVTHTKEIYVAQSSDKTELGSKFRVYAMKATNIQQVCNQNIHLRRKHVAATHVSMIYRFTGLNKAYDEDFIDDMEHSMGQRMLEYLIANNHYDISIGIIGGSKGGRQGCAPPLGAQILSFSCSFRGQN